MVEFNPEVNNNVAPAKGLRPNMISQVTYENSVFTTEEVDTDGDGVYDAFVHTTTTNGVMQERITDKNQDHTVDIIEKFDNNKVVRKEEYTYSEDGYTKFVSGENGKFSSMETYKYDEKGEHYLADVAYDSDGDGAPDYDRPPQMGI